MLMNYHIGRLVLSSLCVGAFVAAGIWWCSCCRLKPATRNKITSDIKFVFHSSDLKVITFCNHWRGEDSKSDIIRENKTPILE